MVFLNSHPLFRLNVRYETDTLKNHIIAMFLGGHRKTKPENGIASGREDE